MIVYLATKEQFINDVILNKIDQQVTQRYIRETGHNVGEAEKRAWSNSLRFMRDIVDDQAIPNDAAIAIEYIIPRTSKRIDFIIAGYDANKSKKAVVIELKQWTEAKAVQNMDGIVKTALGGRLREVPHPSYQVLTYVQYLEDYNLTIRKKQIALIPCAYLHNYYPDNEILNDIYKEYLEQAPVFCKPDVLKLKEFIKQHIKYGDGKILYEIEKGKIKPSKALINVVSSMLQGNQEFILLDEQKVVFEKALYLFDKAQKENSKYVLIVQGGPGTGKSVLAINLLAEFTKREAVAQYVTKNSAPREVLKEKLTKNLKGHKMSIGNLFASSDNFHAAKSNSFDALIVDEAHRLREKSGFYGTQGFNQIAELINTAKFTIFFIDEDQRVTLQDIGSVDEIKKWANQYNAIIEEAELISQFRCNGSDGYLAWLDNTLQIKPTANFTLKDIDYDFKVFDDVALLHDTIRNLNKNGNHARMLAGYTWDWISKKNPDAFDIVIGNYKARWNLTEHGMKWLIHPESVNEIGCIHTCQGLELDYAGVIIGADLLVRDGKVITDFRKRAKTDQSLKGIKKLAKERGEEYAQKIARPIILNTYRVLLSRAMKGTYIYSEDEETREYFRSRI